MSISTITTGPIHVTGDHSNCQPYLTDQHDNRGKADVRNKCDYMWIILSVFAHVIAWSSIIMLSVMDLDFGAYVALIIILPICIIVTFIEAYKSKVFTFLRYKKDFPSFVQKLNEMHQNYPELQVGIPYITEVSNQEGGTDRWVSYHYHTVSTYTSCVDISSLGFPMASRFPTRVTLHKHFEFDLDTKHEYDTDIRRITQHRDEDTNCKLKTRLQLPGFCRNHVLVYPLQDGSQIPKVKHFLLFVLSMLCLCSWPYRWWFRYNTCQLDFTFRKVIGEHTPNTRSIAGWLTDGEPAGTVNFKYRLSSKDFVAYYTAP